MWCTRLDRDRKETTTMKIFTIDSDNNITLHANRKAARETGAGVFVTEEQFADLIGSNSKRLVEIWNSLTGVTPVAKFKDRKTATQRIWKALQGFGDSTTVAATPDAPKIADNDTPAELENVPGFSNVVENTDRTGPTVEHVLEGAHKGERTPHAAAQTPNVAPAEAPAKTRATRAKTPTGPAITKKVPGVATTNGAGLPREGSKASQVIAMLRREGGTTLQEIMTAMGWLQHTTRAMLSAGGSLTKKHGLVVISEKVGDQRKYSIKA